MKVESLEFEVVQSGDSAATSIDKLRESLTKLNEASEFKSLSKLSKCFKKISESVDAISSDAVSRVERLAAALEKISAATGATGGKINIKINDGSDSSEKRSYSTGANDGDSESTISGEDGDAVKTGEHIDVLRMKIRSLKEDLDAALANGDLKGAINKRMQLDSANESLARLEKKLKDISLGAETIPSISDKLKINITSGSEIDLLTEKLTTLKLKLNEALGAGDVRGAISARQQIDSVTAKIEKLKAAQEAAANVSPVSQEFRELMNNGAKIDVLNEKLSILKKRLEEALNAGDTDKAFSIRNQIDSITSSIDRLTPKVKKIPTSVKDVVKSTKSASGFIGKFLNSIKRIALYRIIRTAMKAITDAMNEGSKNAYLFSKTVNGELYQSLTKLSSANYKFTNQFGAAWATLIQAIQPFLIKVLNFATGVAETLTKIFAKLSGSKTYLKAKDITKEWAEDTEKGAAAAKEWKNQLLGFDEINKLDDNTSSGSSSTGTDYGSMFEEVALDDGSLFDFDPYDLGKKIGEKISNAIKSINWSAIWNTLFTAVRNGLDFVSGIIAGIDWESLPGELKRCLTTAFQSLVDSGAMESIGRLVGETISAAIKFTKGLLMTLFGQYIDEEMRKLTPEQRGSVLGVGMAIVRGIIKGILSIQNEIREGMVELVSQFAWGVADALGIGDALREFQSSDNPLAQKGRAAAVSMLTGFKNQATNPAVSILINPVIDKLIDWLQSGDNKSKLEDSGKNLSDELIAGFSEGFSNENTSDMLEKEQKMFDDVIEVGKNTLVVASPSKVFEEIGKFTVEGFENGFISRWKAMRATLEGLFLSFKNWWESRVVNGFKIKMPHISISYSSASASVKKLYGIASIPQMNVSWYAKGGFPDAGDLFFANENGSAELVGSMNGKTTVANQEQIIEGIKRGVIEAMTQVNGQSNKNNSVTLNVNGKQFCRAIYNDFKTVTTEHGISMSHA